MLELGLVPSRFELDYALVSGGRYSAFISASISLADASLSACSARRSRLLAATDTPWVTLGYQDSGV